MSNEDTQFEKESAEQVAVLSRQIIEQIVNAPSGELVKAGSASSNMIRRKIRENGFSRLVIPHRMVAKDDLNYESGTELPVVVGEMEPESPGAVSLTFNDTPDTAFYGLDKFTVYFSKISTREFTKNVDELHTYKNDVRGIITDNALKDMQTEEDARFIKLVDEIVGAYGGTGKSGLQQAHEINGDLVRDTYVEALSHLEDRDLNNGMFLMNRKTAKKFLKWDREEIGGDLAQDLFKEGLAALDKFVIMGVPHAATIKRNLIPDQVVYQFTEPDYLGRAYILQDVTMYVEKKKDILRFSAEEKLGLSIANVSSCNKVSFTV